MASVAGTWGIPEESAYVTSKHGMIGFMDVIANETRETGIVCSCLMPGGIDTPVRQRRSIVLPLLSPSLRQRLSLRGLPMSKDSTFHCGLSIFISGGTRATRTPAPTPPRTAIGTMPRADLARPNI